MIKVLVVDDSALVRKMLQEILDSAPDIQVVGTASDPFIARDKIKQLKPDVLTLDVEMPRMDGVTFLKNLMRLRPMPVVMVSTLTDKGADVTFQAMEIGTVDYIAKPKLDFSHQIQHYSEEIISKVRTASRARVRAYEPPAAGQVAAGKTSPPAVTRSSFSTTDKIVAIGASTGGTEAIREVLQALPMTVPGIVIAQHIPPGFSERFANRLNNACAINVKEARDGDHVIPGHAFVAPGDYHLRLERDGARYICRLDDSDPVNRHKPSVDVLFNSVAERAGRNALGMILTGMGDDGARGLLNMKQAGAPTVAQDEKTSVVWGMPGEAVKRGAADRILGLHEMATVISGYR